jgi:coniferyl-aldehyde dehydrogenase
MSILEAATAAALPKAGGDEAAIANLKAAFECQQDAFASDRSPSLAERRSRVEKLLGMLAGHRSQIRIALSADFGAHPEPASDLIEVLGVMARTQYALAHIEEWMRPVARDVDAAMFGETKAFVQSQPKGVVGNIVPWNFPFDLSIGPLVEMLAAGNRVIIKPSEYTPACAALLRDMVAATFDPDLVHVVVGGLDLAQAFADVPWNHLLYTGSPQVGRQIMQAAARNLTPVTLELGGKCPAVMTPGSVTAENVQSVIGTKIIKNGQMCISADYCLVPRGDVERFVGLSAAFMERAAPDYSRSAECTGMISLRHMDRISGMLEEARAHQCRIVPLEKEGPVDRATRRMPISLVIDPPAGLRIMEEEIFGPILPVIPYDTLDEAITTINAGERPLGVYVFGEEQAAVSAVLEGTTSGGATVNACALQGALPSLGFGGVGMSGMGRHHGVDGFREFSNQRGMVVTGAGNHIDAFYSPYAKAAAIVEGALGPV